MLLEHDVDDGLGAVVDALQVDVDHAIELVVRHFLQLSVLDDARVVDEGVDPAPFGHYPLDHPGYTFFIGDVDREGARLAAAVGDFASDRLGGGLVDVAHGDLGAFLAELDRGGVSDAGAGARNDRNLVHTTHASRLPVAPGIPGRFGHIIDILMRRTTLKRAFGCPESMTIINK